MSVTRTRPRIAVVTFPGSNDDGDAMLALELLGGEPVSVWHADAELPDGTDGVVLPGGFSYGDYLRCGAIARFAPVMSSVRAFADAGGPVLGICNGFQILCEAGLLPGALRRNVGLRFLSQEVHLRVERDDLPFTGRLRRGQVLRMPIAHGDGCYFDRDDRLDALEKGGQVVFRYCSPEGKVDAADPASNPNGSLRAIAGIANRTGNVMALMPHPERCAEPLAGNEDGAELFRSLADAAPTAGRRRAAGR